MRAGLWRQFGSFDNSFSYVWFEFTQFGLELRVFGNPTVIWPAACTVNKLLFGLSLVRCLGDPRWEELWVFEPLFTAFHLKSCTFRFKVSGSRRNKLLLQLYVFITSCIHSTTDPGSIFAPSFSLEIGIGWGLPRWAAEGLLTATSDSQCLNTLNNLKNQRKVHDLYAAVSILVLPRQELKAVSKTPPYYDSGGH